MSKLAEFTYQIKGTVTVTASSLSEAEERVNNIRFRLEDTVNNVEVELLDTVPSETVNLNK